MRQSELMAVPALPSGIVTFLFSDIEGSTRLFRELGDRYPEILDLPQSGVEEGLGGAFGRVDVSRGGDSFLAAFPVGDADHPRSLVDGYGDIPVAAGCGQPTVEAHPH